MSAVLVLLAVRWLGGPLGLVPLDEPTAAPVYPVRGNGVAASVLPALLAVVVLVLVARWVTRRPTPRSRRTRARRPPRRPSRQPLFFDGPPPQSPRSPMDR